MENVLYLSAALGAFAWITTDIVRAHHRSRLRGPRPFEFVLPMDGPGKLGQHARHDGLESLGFSQGVHSVHNGGNA